MDTYTRLHDELFLIPLEDSIHEYLQIFSFFITPTLKYYNHTDNLVTIAYILIKTDLGTEEKVIEDLKKIPQVLKIEKTFGDYDLVIKVEAEHSEKIREVINWDIEKIEKIRGTLTLLKKE